MSQFVTCVTIICNITSHSLSKSKIMKMKTKIKIKEKQKIKIKETEIKVESIVYNSDINHILLV